jgi:antitoxin HicB
MTATQRKPLDYYLTLQYPVHVIADPDGGYVAMFPDLPGCMTQGETLEEIAFMAEDARHGWIETEYERGNDIPLPTYPEEYSGKFNVRLPRSLHRSLAESAEREGVSLNQYVVALLARGDSQARIERRLDAMSARLGIERGAGPAHAGNPAASAPAGRPRRARRPRKAA